MSELGKVGFINKNFVDFFKEKIVNFTKILNKQFIINDIIYKFKKWVASLKRILVTGQIIKYLVMKYRF